MRNAGGTCRHSQTTFILYYRQIKKAREREEIITAYIKKTNNPKMGRPSINPRTNDLRIRLSNAEEEILQEIISKTGKTKTEIVVNGIYRIYDEIQKSN